MNFDQRKKLFNKYQDKLYIKLELQNQEQRVSYADKNNIKKNDLQQVLFSLLLQLYLIRSSKISKTCSCWHVQSLKDSQNSGVCIWKNDYCIFHSSYSYHSKIRNQILCKNYAQEDCREQEQCGFDYGLCIDFVDCSFFNKDQCQESSYKCVSDGSKSVQMQECSDYKTENACTNKNYHGKYRVWIWGTEKICTEVTTCELLPSYLTNHSMFKSGIDGCTISEKGYGCTKQMGSCTQYVYNIQCFESISRKDNCFWDSKNSRCVEKVCENPPFTQDYECKSYLSQCTTNGVYCVLRKQCSDALGQKCEYHKNQCCNTAPELLTNYL
ncbi:unnamed protein product [Paramecium octaurelia]|uniref:Uncharacterized protein n=1 Tax=Paramecium octaurelia TaxID=43137 RepID=A0A8S1WF27_PAROT|nr:unnamed protein product [Paramecium octaurelia]